MSTRVRLVLLMLLIPSIAQATVGDALLERSCPVCSSTVQWYRSQTYLPFRVLERDLRGHQYYEAYFTCESCLFSGTPEDFQDQLDPHTISRIREADLRLPAGTSRPVPKPWRAHLTAEIRKVRGASPENLAFVFMNGAWANRYEDLEFTNKLWPGHNASRTWLVQRP